MVRWDPNRIYLSVATPPANSRHHCQQQQQQQYRRGGTKEWYKGERSAENGRWESNSDCANPVGKRLKRALRSAQLSSAPLRSGTTYRVVALNSIRLLPPLHRPQSRAAATTPCSLLKPSAPLPWLRLPSSSPGILGELLRKCFLCVSV